VVASGGGVIKVWDLEDVERPPLTVDHGSTLRAVAVAADGRTALSVADGRGMVPYWFVAARLWDLDTGAELRLVRFVDQVFECVALAPDARRIVFRSLTRSGVDRLQAADLDEGEAEVWEGPDGVRRYLVDGRARTLQDPSFVEALAVTPAGGLAISSQDAPAGDQAGLSLFEVDGGGARGSWPPGSRAGGCRAPSRSRSPPTAGARSPVTWTAPCASGTSTGSGCGAPCRTARGWWPWP
jgi:hypothetical protein